MLTTHPPIVHTPDPEYLGMTETGEVVARSTERHAIPLGLDVIQVYIADNAAIWDVRNGTPPARWFGSHMSLNHLWTGR